jgi:hypothetical protein
MFVPDESFWADQFLDTDALPPPEQKALQRVSEILVRLGYEALDRMDMPTAWTIVADVLESLATTPCPQCELLGGPQTSTRRPHPLYPEDT